MVSAVSLNFVVSHSPEFPTEFDRHDRRNMHMRWNLITMEIWEKINVLTSNILGALEFQSKNKIKWLNVSVAKCGLAGLSAPDPMDAFECRMVFSPWVVMNLEFDAAKKLSSYRQSQGACVNESDVATWWQAGIQILESEIHHSDSLGGLLTSTSERVEGARALSASAEPFVPPSHEAIIFKSPTCSNLM